MSRLINRKPASRLDCLHSLMKLLYSEFGTGTLFSMNEAKFDKSRANIFDHCPLLIRDENLGLNYKYHTRHSPNKPICWPVVTVNVLSFTNDSMFCLDKYVHVIQVQENE